MSYTSDSIARLSRVMLIAFVTSITLNTRVGLAQPNIQNSAPRPVPAERTVRDADSEEFRKIFQALLDDRTISDRNYIRVLNVIYIAIIDYTAAQRCLGRSEYIEQFRQRISTWAYRENNIWARTLLMLAEMGIHSGGQIFWNNEFIRIDCAEISAAPESYIAALQVDLDYMTEILNRSSSPRRTQP
jgi:hypothetical protein